MNKPLNARCIRRWEVQMRDVCDSQVNPWWRKRDLRGYIRECGLITAYCMVERMAEDNAKVDYQGDTFGCACCNRTSCTALRASRSGTSLTVTIAA